MSVVVGISAEDEAEHHRVGKTQKWFHEALLIAESEDQLLPGTDCLQLSQLLAASQWGVTLMWQKGLISLETLRRQATHQTLFGPYALLSHGYPQVAR